jgi:hypothetical protein
MGDNSLRSCRKKKIGSVEFARNVQYLMVKTSVEIDPTVVRQRSHTLPEVFYVWDLSTYRIMHVQDFPLTLYAKPTFPYRIPNVHLLCEKENVSILSYMR